MMGTPAAACTSAVVATVGWMFAPADNRPAPKAISRPVASVVYINRCQPESGVGGVLGDPGINDRELRAGLLGVAGLLFRGFSLLARQPRGSAAAASSFSLSGFGWPRIGGRSVFG